MPAEVWLGTAGWQRIDPIGGSGADAGRAGIADALPASDRLPLAIRGQPALLRALRLGWIQWSTAGISSFSATIVSSRHSLLQQLGIDELASYRTGLIAGGALLALLPSLLWLAGGASAVRPPIR